MCSSSLLTVRMGARGMSEITVRGPTGAKQWLIQAQQENISSSTPSITSINARYSNEKHARV